jgi:hypothetical protein
MEKALKQIKQMLLLPNKSSKVKQIKPYPYPYPFPYPFPYP